MRTIEIEVLPGLMATVAIPDWTKYVTVDGDGTIKAWQVKPTPHKTLEIDHYKPTAANVLAKTVGERSTVGKISLLSMTDLTTSDPAINRPPSW